MTTAQNTIRAGDTDRSSLAFIEAQNIRASFPIREYLEGHGCTVLVNYKDQARADYHIAMGDIQFVKSIFAIPEKIGDKRLGIVLNNQGDILPEEADRINAKIIATGEQIISSRYVPSMFAFFFTSESSVLILDGSGSNEARNLPEKIAPVNLQTENPLQNKEDKRRIAQLIHRIYEKPKKKSFWSTTFHAKIFWVFCTCLILAMPFLVHAATLTLSIATLGITAVALKNDIPSVGQASGTMTRALLDASSRSLDLGKTLLYPLPPAHRLLRSQERILSLLTSGTLAAESLIRLREEGKTLSQLIFADGLQDKASVVSVESIRKELSYLQRFLGVFIADSTSYRESGRSGNALFSYLLGRVQAQTPRLLRVVTTADRVLSLYPYLGGFTEEKNYVLLLQNNAELRPTGGFIGGVAQARVQDGKLADFTILDVYDLDGQLRGHVDPPAPIREVLGEVHWYLRDSNWDPDFRISGDRALWFYEKESGTVADGVVAVNTRLLRDVLRVLGPVDLIDYQDRITEDNFFEKSFSYIHSDFFPGSTQKKDFLGSLVNAILVKITNSSQTDVLALLDLLVEGIAQHDILVYIKDEQTQKTIDQYNWSNRVPAYTPCAESYQTTCMGDYVFTVDANLGLSKVNQHIQKKLTHEISMSEGDTREETLQLVYDNNAQANAQGGDVYRNYLRIYLPESVHIQEITLDGLSLPEKTAATASAWQIPYIEPSDAPQGLSSVGVVFDIQAGKSRTISLLYDAENQPQGNSTLLDMYYQRQPGLDQTITTIINYPEAWKFVPINAGASGADFVAKPGRFEYNNTRRSDTVVQAKITK